MGKVLYREEQRFTQWWRWLLVLSACTIPIVIIATELTISSDNTAEEVTTLLVVLCFVALFEAVLIWLFWSMKLIIEINETGIRFKYPPVIRKWRIIKKSEVQSFEVRQYKPIAEYGGWGIKVKFRNSGIAYNVKGNIGLQLYLKNGKKLLLGTQRKQAIDYAMCKLMGSQFKGNVMGNKVGQSQKSFLGRKTKKFLLVILIELVLGILIFSLIQILK